MSLTKSSDIVRAFLSEADPLPPEDGTVVPNQATADLYQSQRPRLLRFLRRRVSPDGADDLVQQTFVRFLVRASDPSAVIVCPEGYLRRTASNLAINAAATARARSEALHIALDETILPGVDQLAALEARDTLARLEVALQRLPTRSREIFLAHRIDGYTYGEIASRTGLSVKTVEKHMSRAIAHIDRVISAR